MGGWDICLCPYPILLHVTQQDCNKVENGYKTLENLIGVTFAIFTAHSEIVILQFYKDVEIAEITHLREKMIFYAL